MNIGTVDIYANHVFVFLGPEDLPVLEFGQEPAASDGRHLAVRTRGQEGPTRVSIWRGAMPAVGECVYQGVLTVEDYRIWIEDLERLNRYVKMIGVTGPQPVMVYVDDPGDASRVYVGFGLTDAPVRRQLTAVAGHPLPDVLAAPDHDLIQVNELGFIFDDYDSPIARLAGALKLLSRPRADARAFPDRFDIELLAQWLRRLAWSLPRDGAVTVCELARDRIGATEPTGAAFGLSDDQALALTIEIMNRI